VSKRKSGLNINGILLLDKPLGISSNRALQEVRRLFNANKAGHTGSLDPLATGLLPLCFGEGTKVSGLMLENDKAYQVAVKLGVITDTGDCEGHILETRTIPTLSIETIEACLQTFVGTQSQIPPMYSALKVNGKKLYELAREGKIIERKARNINIYDIRLITFTNDTLTLDVTCSKGTYIRSLAEDIGFALGCGGMVSALRRTEVGDFLLSDAVTIDELVAMNSEERVTRLLPVDVPLAKWPSQFLSTEQATAICHGQPIDLKEHEVSGHVRLYAKNVFLGLGQIGINGKLLPVRLFNLND
jgi:tRNA pseudouridine55 synthase